MFPQVLKADFVEKHTEIDQLIEASTYLRITASKNNPKTKQSVPLSVLLFVILPLVCIYWKRVDFEEEKTIESN